jgi:nucleoside-diphosphate-sugar epimerase
MRKALVTGAGGFIGRHLLNLLNEKKVDVNALVRNKKSFNSPACANIFEGDIFDSETLKRASEGVDTVFHLVAKTHDLSNSGDNERDYFRINVDGTKTLLDACASSGIKHFVYFSSIKVMAEKSEAVLDETSPLNPSTPYGESKLAAERLVSDYGIKYGFATASIRLPLVYGPGNKGNIYRMIEAIDKGRFIMMGPGDKKRSMVYVGNVVDAAVAFVERSGGTNATYIVTDGIHYTVKELYEIIAKELGRRPMPFSVPMSVAKVLARAGDIGSRIIGKQLPFNSDMLNKLVSPLAFSSRRIRQEIGFTPKYNLSNTIKETVNWYRHGSRQ